MTTIRGELVGEGVEALAECCVVASGLVGVDQRPSCVDLADERAAWSTLAEVATNGWGENVFAVRDSDPDPDGREMAFSGAQSIFDDDGRVFAGGSERVGSLLDPTWLTDRGLADSWVADLGFVGVVGEIWGTKRERAIRAWCGGVVAWRALG